MLVRVTFKSEFGAEHREGKEKDFKGVGYAVTDEGDIDIYGNETDVVATVKSEEWLYVEKIYEEGDEGPDIVVRPKDAAEVAEYISEGTQPLAVDNTWVPKL